MSIKLLQINYNLNVPRAEYELDNVPWAGPISQVAGLRWKTWIINEAQHEAGGIYLFDDDASLQAFLAGPIVAELKSDPTLDASLKSFDVSLGLSEVTRAPIEEPVRA
jgi:hypothetical protein